MNHLSDILTALDLGIGAVCLWKLIAMGERVRVIEAFVQPGEKPVPPDEVKPSVPRTKSRDNVHPIKKRAKTHP